MLIGSLIETKSLRSIENLRFSVSQLNDSLLFVLAHLTKERARARGVEMQLARISNRAEHH